MNIETINYIGKIAGMTEAKALNAAVTLKAIRAYVENAISEEETQYVEVDGVDFAEVVKHLSTLATQTRRANMVALSGSVVAAMNQARDAYHLDRRVAHAIKKAAEAGLTVTAAEVLSTSVAQETVNFSVARCIDELKEQAEAKQAVEAPVVAPKPSKARPKAFAYALLAIGAVASLTGCVSPALRDNAPASLSNLELCQAAGMAKAHNNPARLRALSYEHDHRVEVHTWNLTPYQCNTAMNDMESKIAANMGLAGAMTDTGNMYIQSLQPTSQRPTDADLQALQTHIDNRQSMRDTQHQLERYQDNLNR